jgi:hypothetical protein
MSISQGCVPDLNEHRPTKPGAACSTQAGRTQNYTPTAARRRSIRSLAARVLRGDLTLAQADAALAVSAERWLPVAGWGRYEVSDLGRVRVAATGRLRKISPDSRGRNRFTAVGKRTLRVAQLVAEAFVGPRPPGAEVDHVNGVKTDDRASNLEYVTGEENRRRAQALGLCKRPGERNGRALLTEADVAQIRSQPGPMRDLAARYGVSRHTIGDVLSGRRWPHVGFGGGR